MTRRLSILLLSVLVTGSALTAQSDFEWPEGKKAAVSLSFDDARVSQIDAGMELLNKHGVRATFYVSIDAMMERLEGWKAALAARHEIGNHTLTHHCSGTFLWARSRPVNEEMTLEDARHEYRESNRLIYESLGVTPSSFAYPCGMTTIGRGRSAQSLVPLTAEIFQSARTWQDEMPSDPAFTDLAQLTGMDMDAADFEDIKPLVDNALEQGLWLVLGGHEMGETGAQTVRLEMLDQLIPYIQSKEEIWLGTVGEVATWVEKQRN